MSIISNLKLSKLCTYKFNLYYYNQHVHWKKTFFSVSECSNTVSPEDGVAYTVTCRELYETWCIVFFSVRVVYNNTN
jgi:hypothetical protein